MEFIRVAHLYKNVPIFICEPDTKPVSHYLEGIDWRANTAIAERVNYPIEWVKPLLRPLSSMTETEGLQILGSIYHNIFTYNPTPSKVEVVRSEDSDEFGLIVIDKDGDRIGLTIEIQRGIELSVNNSKLMVRQFDYIPMLLNNHFDLFELHFNEQCLYPKDLNAFENNNG